MLCDIGQPQCHKCTSRQKITTFFFHLQGFFVCLYICYIVVDQCHMTLTPQCHPNVFGVL